MRSGASIALISTSRSLTFSRKSCRWNGRTTYGRCEISKWPTNWLPDISGTTNRMRSRPPSSGATPASSRNTWNVGDSTPISAILAISSEYSAVFSSACSIGTSGTTRTRQPSESNICFNAPEFWGSSSRTRIPTCRTVALGRVAIGKVYCDAREEAELARARIRKGHLSRRPGGNFGLALRWFREPASESAPRAKDCPCQRAVGLVTDETRRSNPHNLHLAPNQVTAALFADRSEERR